jgi:hypothetical protein
MEHDPTAAGGSDKANAVLGLSMALKDFESSPGGNGGKLAKLLGSRDLVSK